MVRWDQGRDIVDDLIRRGDLERVVADRSLADRLLASSRRHIASARLAGPADPEGAFQLAYDAARKALLAVLQNQGLRATSRGGHVAIGSALRAQLDPPMGDALDCFTWMRRLRNATEYPRPEQASAHADDLTPAIACAERLTDMAHRLLDAMPVY